MTSSSVCGTCLASNTKMYNIASTPYQELLDKLTNKVRGSGSVCGACAAQLRRCSRFAEAARRAAELLAQLQRSGLQTLTEETIKTLDKKFVPQLTWTPIQSMSLNGSSEFTPNDVKMVIQEEPTIFIEQPTVIEVFSGSMPLPITIKQQPEWLTSEHIMEESPPSGMKEQCNVRVNYTENEDPLTGSELTDPTHNELTGIAMNELNIKQEIKEEIDSDNSLLVTELEIEYTNNSESTKASTTELQTIMSRRKTNAQRCREYRERKKLQSTTAERSHECCESDQLQTKKPKTNAERRKKHYEAQKLKKQGSKKIPKTARQRNKEYYERKKIKKALNTLNHHSDALKELSGSMPLPATMKQPEWPTSGHRLEEPPSGTKEQYNVKVNYTENEDPLTGSELTDPTHNELTGIAMNELNIKQEIEEEIDCENSLLVNELEIEGYFYTENEDPLTEGEPTGGDSNNTLLVEDVSKRNGNSRKLRREQGTGKRHHCELCEKNYAHKFLLNRHMKTHTKAGSPAPRRFACAVCGRRFKMRATLLRHAALHAAGGVRYCCDVCGHATRQKYNLAKHMLQHTDMTPVVPPGVPPRLACPLCSATFARAGDRARHTTQYHANDKRHPCPFPPCTFRGANISVINTHMLKEHGGTHNEKPKCQESLILYNCL